MEFPGLASQLVGHIELALVGNFTAIGRGVADAFPLTLRLPELSPREVLLLVSDELCRARVSK